MSKLDELNKKYGLNLEKGSSVKTSASGAKTQNSGAEVGSGKSRLDALNEKYGLNLRSGGIYTDGAGDKFLVSTSATPVYAPTLEEERANERDKMLTPSVSRQTGKTANIPELRRAAEEMALDPNAFARASEKTSRAGDFVGALALGTGKTATNLGGVALEGLRALNNAAYEQNNAQQRTAQENSLAYWQQQLKSAKTQAERDRAQAQIDRASRALGSMDNLKETETRDVMNVANKVYSVADDLSEQELALQERSKEGLGAVGTTLMDAGYSFAQSMMDGGIGALTGTGMLPFVARAFSGSAQEARKVGADFGQQMTYASSQAAKEYITEKLFGIALPQKVIGKAGRGGLDGVIENVIAKAVGKVESTGGQKALGGLLTWLTGGVTEGLEEGIGDFIENNILNPLLENKLPPELTTQNSKEDYLSDMLLGGISGLMGVTNLFTYSPYNAAADRAIEMLTGQRQESTPAAAQDAQESAQRVSRETMTPARETPQSGLQGTKTTTQDGGGAQAGTLARFYEERVARMTGENGGRAFVSQYDGAQDITEYTADFLRYWNAGATGKKLGTVQNSGSLSEPQRFAAYSAGQNDAKISLNSEMSAASSVKANVQSGISTDEMTARNTKAWSEQQRGTVDTLGKKLGVRVVVDDTISAGETGANGYFDAKTNEIHVAKDAKNPALQVLRHEATHRMQQLSPKEYRVFRDYAVRMAGEDAVEEKMRAYSRGDVLLSEEEAMDEIAAETAEKLLTDETAISDFIRENRTAAQKFYDALRSIVQKVKEALGADQTLAQAERLWKNAFEKADAQARTSSLQEGKSGDTMTPTQFSMKEDSENGRRKEERAAFIQRAAGNGYSVYEGKTAAYGFRRVRYSAESGYSEQVTQEAGEAQRELKALGIAADIIDGPVSRNSNGVTTTRDVQEAVTVAGSFILINRNTTVSPRNVAGHEAFHLWKRTESRNAYIETVEDNLIFNSDAFIQYQANIAEAYLGGEADLSNDAQMDKLREELFAYISGDIHEGTNDEYLRPMLRDMDAVKAAWNELVSKNSDGKKFSLKTDSEGRELSERQQEYFKDSKSVDADGRLKVMYQGGNGDFTVFDRKKSKGSNLYGRGFYFTDSEAQAKQYGGTRAFYLNVTNPLTPGQSSITRQQMRDFLSAVAENEDYGLENYGYGATVDSVLESVYGKGDFEMLQDVNATAIGDLVAAAELFNEVNGTDYDGIVLPTETVTFRSNQAKNVTNAAPTDNADIRFSLKSVTPEEAKANADAVLKFFGRTYNWNETGYITADGARVDLSGRHDGAPGGYRTVDHRDVRDALGLDYGGDDYSGAMVQFMHEGNIRISPESGGINIQIEPTKAQYDKLEQFVQHNKGEVTLDLDDENGNTVGSVEYAPRTRASRVISDIKAYFADGTIPEQTEEGIFRYSLKNNSPEAVAAKQQEMIEWLRGQLRRSRGVTTKKGDVAKIARATAKAWDSSADVTERLQAMYDFMANGKDASGNELTWDDLWGEAKSIAGDMLSESMTRNDDLYREYADLRRTVRDTKLNVPKEMDGDLDAFGGYGEFRRGEGRALNLSRSEGMGIDDFFQTLADSYPEYFDEAMTSNPADQLARIAEVMNDLKPVYENRFAGDEQAVNYLADELINSFYDARQEAPTFADKAALGKQEAVAKVKNAARDKLNAREAKLRSAYDERIAKMREMNRQKIDERMSKLREQRDKKIEAVKEKYKAKDAKGREKRSARELRGKIIRHAKKLSGELLRPTDKHHIPERLRKSVAAVLESINLESSGGKPTKRTAAWQNLKAQYERLLSDGEDIVIDADFLGADGLFETLAQMSDKPIADMSTEELSLVWRALRGVEGSIQSVNKAFALGKFKEISEASESLRAENRHKKDKRELANAVGDAAQTLVTLESITPETYFHQLGKAGDRIFRALRDAQDKQITLTKKAIDFTRSLLGEADISALEKETHEVTLGGERVKLTTAQIMELYVLSRREQAINHIVYGGGIHPDTFSDGGIYKETRAEPIRGITLEDIADAVSVLTKEQIALAEAMQDYLSTECAAWGNEASMTVYNYEKFGEAHYWPIRTSETETKKDVQTYQQVVPSIGNSGFAQATKKGANTSIRIGSIFDTYAKHVADMANYSAWLATSEDMRRVQNFRFMADGVQVGNVQGVLAKVHGARGGDYWMQLMTNIAAGVQNEKTLTGGLTGAYKAAAVGANIRVIIQQPTAIIRAASMIDGKYFANRMNPVKGWEKAKQYAPIAQWKDWGYFDISTGRKTKDLLFESDSKLEKTKNALMQGAALADSVSWGALWNACESETRAEHKELSVGSEAYYEAVAKRFTEIIDHTQVVDGVLQRSQIMRRPGELTKMITAFMGEPTKTANMLYSAVYDFRNATGESGRKEAKAKLGRTGGAVAASLIVNAIAQSLVDGLRDDDRDKKYWEKFASALKENANEAFNPFSYYAVAKDIKSIFQGYDVERMDVSSISDFVSSVKTMRRSLDGEGKMSIPNATVGLVAALARFYGIPLYNIKRDIESIVNTFANETGNYVMQYHMTTRLYNPRYDDNKSRIKDILFDAYQNDQGAYEIIYADIVKHDYFATETTTTEKAIVSAIESRMKAAQGVTKVEDMERRYYTPEQQKHYDTVMRDVTKSNVWKSASAEQRKALEKETHTYLAGSGDDAQRLTEKIAEGEKNGITESEYLLYMLALEITEKPNEDGKKDGNPTNDELEEAIRMLQGLSDKERSYLWSTKRDSDVNDPWK